MHQKPAAQKQSALRKLVPAAAAALLAGTLVGLIPPVTAAANSGTVTYTATASYVAPPASNFSGAGGGGDGWGVALTATRVYNVFHHQTTLDINCHNQSDASACWTGSKVITDASGNNFATSGQPGMYIDQASGHLFVFATRTSDTTPGVVCIDTTQPATNPNPYCGFTALAPAGQAASVAISNISDPVQIGTNWFAFNYANGSPTGAQDQLLCFDLTTLAACASQPYAVNTGVANYNDGTYPEPSIAAFGNEIVIPASAGGNYSLGCYDPSAGGVCPGTWPVVSSLPTGVGAPFPLLSTTGTLQGFCFAYAADPCYSLSGAVAATPSNLASVTGSNTAWNSPGLTLGPRVYLANGNQGPGFSQNQLDCFDYSANASCPNFPVNFPNLSYIYSVNPDWQRPTCMWVNADAGSSQIQNVDAYTGGACGTGPIRILSSTSVAPGAPCVPGTWSSFQVTTPARGTYTSATVQFVDSDNTPIPGTSTQTLDATGSANLTGMNLTGGNGLPQFLLTFTGATNLTQVDTKLTWNGTYDPSCIQPATTVSGYTMAATATPSSAGVGGVVTLSEAGLPTGTTGGSVVFTNAATSAILCTATIDASGNASCTTSSTLAAAAYSVTATYAGNSNYVRTTAATAFSLVAAAQVVPVPATGANPGLWPEGLALIALGVAILTVPVPQKRS